MKKIKDFFYSFSDILFAIFVVLGVVYILYININSISHLEAKQNNEISLESKEEKNIEVNVTIPIGINLEQLTDILYEYEIIGDKNTFLNSFTNKDVKIKSGDFTLIKSMDISKIKELVIEK